MNSTNGKNKISMTRLRAIGAVLSLVEAVTAALFIYLLNGTGMIPWKYIMAAFAVMAVMVLLVVILVSLRSRRTRIVAIVLSALMIIVQLIGSNYLYRTMHLLKDAESSYKTDYLNIVVRADDPAQEIADTKGYQFGIVDDLSKDEKETLLETIRRDQRHWSEKSGGYQV